MTKTSIFVLLSVLAVIVLGVGIYFFMKDPEIVPNTNIDTNTTNNSTATTTVEVDETKTVIGQSADGQDITAYHYGEGETELLFVGGIHGGYAWNTTLVAYELMDHLEANSDDIPENIKVTVIPVFNPDGLESVLGTSTARFTADDIEATTEELVAGRFNGNEVDLNRNFDCDWNENATWQNRSVEPGTGAFSEPESQAFRDYIEANEIEAVVVWYSAAGGVFASSCHNGVSEDTKTLTDLYSEASGYRAYQEFNFYEITGDMVNWLARENIPAISVLLTTHDVIEWDKNLKGIEALFNHYAE
jgi:hypothetical protein